MLLIASGIKEPASIMNGQLIFFLETEFLYNIIVKWQNSCLSKEWFGKDDKMGLFIAALRNQGHPDHMFGENLWWYCNTWSDLTPCNGHFRSLRNS
jgi:hypothetical protein